jgi:GDP-D-mannose dehydratase
MKTALIAGITGQDGAYLSKLLLEKGYKVLGAARRSASQSQWRLAEINLLQGSYDKARTELGWHPTLTFEGLAETMSKADYDRVKSNRLLG